MSWFAKKGSFITRVLALTSPRMLILAGFLLFPNVRTDDVRVAWLPVGPDVIRTVVICLLIGWGLVATIRERMESGTSLVSMLLLFAFFSLAIFNADSGEYGEAKVGRLFSTTLLSGCAPFFLMRTRRDIRDFLYALSLVGILYASLGLIALINNPQMADRLTAGGSNPITLARMAATPLLWFALLGVGGQIPVVVSLAVCLPCSIVVLASGSKGPVISAVCSIILAFLWVGSPKKRLRKIVMLAGIAGVIAILIEYRETILPPASFTRFEALLEGRIGESERGRARAAEASLGLIAEHPLGIGWGSFANYTGIISVVEMNVYPYSIIGLEAMRYPHNLLLEVAAEAGWIGGGLFVALILIAMMRAYRARDRLEMKAFLMFFGVSVANSLLSGDVNTNRLVFCLISIGLVIPVLKTGEAMEREGWRIPTRGGYATVGET